MKKNIYRIAGGLLLIIIGLAIWLSNLGILHINWKQDWPVILIIIGVLELIKNIRRRKI